MEQSEPQLGGWRRGAWGTWQPSPLEAPKSGIMPGEKAAVSPSIRLALCSLLHSWPTVWNLVEPTIRLPGKPCVELPVLASVHEAVQLSVLYRLRLSFIGEPWVCVGGAESCLRPFTHTSWSHSRLDWLLHGCLRFCWYWGSRAPASHTTCTQMMTELVPCPVETGCLRP